MMTALREKTALILWFVIFAFVGLIVVEWGADYTGGQGPQAVSDDVGVVNGEAVSLKDFQAALRQAASQMPRDQRADESVLVRQVWDSYVQEVLLTQEIERLGVQVTDKEIAYYTRMQPPSAVQSLESFQTDGQFDMAKYTQFIGDPNNLKDSNNRSFVMQVEYMLRQQLLNYKLQRLLMSSVQVTPAEVRDFFAERNEKVQIDFVAAPGSAVGDDEVEVVDTDITAYYEENSVNFANPEQVSLSYAYFPKVASAADSQLVADEIVRLREEIIAGADFAELAEVVSDDQGSAAQGGTLGTFGRGRMVKPFSDAAFALEPGQLSEPVRTRFGWHLIKVEDKTVEDGEDKVTASHILLNFRLSRSTEDALRDQADEFEAKANEAGFEAALAASGIEATDSGYLQRDQMVPSLGQGTAWLVNWALSQDVGAVSRVAENERGIWIATVVDKRAEGTLPLDEVRSRIKREVLASKKADVAAEKLREVRQVVESGGSLEEAASAAGFEVRQSALFSRAESVPGIGRANSVTAAAFNMDVDELSNVLTIQEGAYLVKLVEREPVNEALFAEQSAQIQQQLLAQRQQEALQSWFVQLYEAAVIEDNRHQFFTF